MATQLQIRRGTSSQVAAFTGAEGEIVVNTTNDSVHVNDGSTAGGFELARADLNNVSAITIDSSENVGIGTTPDNKLHVYKGASGHSWSFDSGDAFIVENNDSVSINIATPSTNSANILFSDADARGQGRIAYDHSSDYMAFYTAGVSNEAMRIDATSIKPTVPIEIGSSSYFLGNATNGYRFNNAANTSNLMILQDSGNLIVGGTSDGAAGSITLQGDGDIRGVLSSGAGGDTLISAISGVSNGYQISVTTGNAQTYKWHNGGTQSMTLDASGNLLVGTTVLTDIDSSGTGNEGAYIKADGQIGLASSNQLVAIFNRKTIDGSIVELRKDGSPVGSIGSGSGGMFVGSSAQSSGIGFFGTAIYPNNGGTISATNGVNDIGAATARWKDLYLSGGVNFGDAGGSGTSSSNLLDDYEEGTWTPTVLYGSTGVSVVISRSKYVKIGSMVTVSATFGITSSPSTGAMSIQNLPFSSNVNVETTGSIMLYNVDFDVDTVNVVTYQYNSANKIEVYATKDNSPWYRLNHSNIGNGDSIIFTHTYFTA